jgi:TorA maturation chaperone TorD
MHVTDMQPDQVVDGRDAVDFPLVDALRTHAGLYRILGRCLESELDSELLTAIRGELAEALGEAGFDFGEEFQGASDKALLEQLAEEFTMLMVAPGASMPYASVAAEGAMFQDPAERAEAAYREAGYRFEQRHSGEFADHVGTMLSFIGLEMAAEAAAHERCDGAAAERHRSCWAAFLLKEVGPWAPGWCRRTSAAAMHPFYREVTRHLEQLLWDDLGWLADRKQLKRLADANRQEPPRLDYDADFRKASGL